MKVCRSTEGVKMVTHVQGWHDLTHIWMEVHAYTSGKNRNENMRAL